MRRSLVRVVASTVLALVAVSLAGLALQLFLASLV